MGRDREFREKNPEFRSQKPEARMADAEIEAPAP
jgi:hypothetical protein